MTLNETHDPALRSWVASAQAPACDFTIQNLPFAVFRRHGSAETWRGGVAIGDQVVDLSAAVAAGVFDASVQAIAAAAAQDTLNDFLALGQSAWSALRLALSRALREGAAQQAALQACLVAQDAVEYKLPTRMGGFTDFFTSIYHARNAGRISRPENPLTPNYPWVPIAYHSRVSSIRVSGHEVRRPKGQFLAPGQDTPVYGPSEKMDFELEMGWYVGTGNAQGEAIDIADAAKHLFGVCLLNDWSARDVQRWEAAPLGPFLAKNFATTVSPWIVTREALAPYHAPLHRDAGYEAVLPYLDAEEDRRAGALDIELAMELQTARMRAQGQAAQPLVQTNAKFAFWTPAQMVAHHTVNGCNLETGDLLGTGTMSGPTDAEACALIELTVGGSKPVVLANGESRGYLADGDTVTFKAWCAKPGAARIGFGRCTGTLVA
jgi:fumarylacetoacetase